MAPLINLFKAFVVGSILVVGTLATLFLYQVNEELVKLTTAVDDGAAKITRAMEGEPRGPRPTIEEPTVDDLLERQREERSLGTMPADYRRGLEVVKTREVVDYKKLDVFCLAKNIYHEAGIEDELGKYAVAQVTLNRMKNPKYPTTVCDVVYDYAQFSWTLKKSIRWTRPKGPLWAQSVKVAEQVLIHGHRVQGLEKANYYHADYVNPRWKKPSAKIAQIGTHIFYASAR